jgi:hypothetical protein
MPETILIGREKQMAELPRHVWEAHLARVPEHAGERLSFMTPDHHRVRYFVVSEMPRIAKPIPPVTISERLGLSLARVNALLEDLEQHLTFLVRDEAGDVIWAYPLTVEKTPHAITFNSGERLYAA